MSRGKDKKKNETKEEIAVKSFYGPPTSCGELNSLGYTLNGYYLVKDKEKDYSTSSRGIKVVFCQFKKIQGTKDQCKTFFKTFQNTKRFS